MGIDETCNIVFTNQTLLVFLILSLFISTKLSNFLKKSIQVVLISSLFISMKLSNFPKKSMSISALVQFKYSYLFGLPFPVRAFLYYRVCYWILKFYSSILNEWSNSRLMNRFSFSFFFLFFWGKKVEKCMDKILEIIYIYIYIWRERDFRNYIKTLYDLIYLYLTT